MSFYRAVLRHAVLRLTICAALCYATPCYVTPGYAMPCFAMPCFATPCYTMLRFATPYFLRSVWFSLFVGLFLSARWPPGVGLRVSGADTLAYVLCGFPISFGAIQVVVSRDAGSELQRRGERRG